MGSAACKKRDAKRREGYGNLLWRSPNNLFFVLNKVMKHPIENKATKDGVEDTNKHPNTVIIVVDS